MRIIADTYRPGMPQTCRLPGTLWLFAIMLTGDEGCTRCSTRRSGPRGSTAVNGSWAPRSTRVPTSGPTTPSGWRTRAPTPTRAWRSSSGSVTTGAPPRRSPREVRPTSGPVTSRPPWRTTGRPGSTPGRSARRARRRSCGPGTPDPSSSSTGSRRPRRSCAKSPRTGGTRATRRHRSRGCSWGSCSVSRDGWTRPASRRTGSGRTSRTATSPSSAASCTACWPGWTTSTATTPPRWPTR